MAGLRLAMPPAVLIPLTYPPRRAGYAWLVIVLILMDIRTTRNCLQYAPLRVSSLNPGEKPGDPPQTIHRPPGVGNHFVFAS